MSTVSERDKMTYENIMKWYSFDPFKHISREQATVGALRKAAEGHDVSIRALSHQEGRTGVEHSDAGVSERTPTTGEIRRGRWN